MSKFKKIVDEIKSKDIKFVEYRFTDTHGKWHHVTVTADEISEKSLEAGLPFDGSSIEGWKPIHDSDMVLKPDAELFIEDPFTAQATGFMVCNIFDVSAKSPYIKDPRTIATNAEKFLTDSKIGDTANFGPEPEFFIFDEVRSEVTNFSSFYSVDSYELSKNNAKKYPEGNLGHRPGIKGGYFPVTPVDSAQDIRSEMITVMREMGLNGTKHHHEVAPAQHEIGWNYSTLQKAADYVQICKYAILNVANSYGKSATFMPKPIYKDNGSGMHVHQSIWKDGKNVFANYNTGKLSDQGRWYIGGIIKHAKALNAFTNAITNSYKRLVPGFEAPVILAYSALNRSAAIRLPYASSSPAIRIETRFPDAASNPYLAFSSMLLAGLDGIKNKIEPGASKDVNLYELSKVEIDKIPRVSRSLRESLEHLDKDRGFLTKSGVFTDEMIDSYINLKFKEIFAIEMHPHPLEFEMYYSR